MQHLISLPLAEEKARVSRQREAARREHAVLIIVGILLGGAAVAAIAAFLMP